MDNKESPSLGAPQDRPERKQDEMPDELARSATPEIRDRQPAAVPDAGAPQESAGREYGWVIEHNEPLPTGLPLYWRCPTQRLISREIEHVFDPDHQWAVRFARREDAERMIGWLNVPGKAAEHLWLAPAAHQERTEPTDNGNSFVFCDYVEEGRGCVRGVGHNGQHALSLPPYPDMPIRLSRKRVVDENESRVDISADRGMADVPLHRSSEVGAPARAAEWQPIETAPKDGTNVLLGWPTMVLGGYWADWRGRKAWVTSRGEYQGENAPTVWMPLPLPPGALAG